MTNLARAAGIPIGPDTGASTAFHEWQAHLAAGRLTAATGPQTTPEIAANRTRTERIILGRAAARRTAIHAAAIREGR